LLESLTPVQVIKIIDPNHPSTAIKHGMDEIVPGIALNSRYSIENIKENHLSCLDAQKLLVYYENMLRGFKHEDFR
jgi:hypothetical protein